MALLQQGTSRKQKTRTGCVTCKIRRVKCDEKFPICNRCISAGRACDGYGIWGGGSKQYDINSTMVYAQCPRLQAPDGRRRTLQLNRGPVLRSLYDPNPEDQALLDFFNRSTMGKLPGASRSVFWDELVFQASFSEPAVLHAVLALSSVLKRDIVAGVACHVDHQQIPNREEGRMLQHYCRSIKHLQNKLACGNKAALRVILITCMLFTYLETNRGNYVMSNKHLDSGLRLLDNIGSSQHSAQRANPHTRPNHLSLEHWLATLDGCLADTYRRVSNHIGDSRCRTSPWNRPVHLALCGATVTDKFESQGAARHLLDRIFESLCTVEKAYYMNPISATWSQQHTRALMRDQALILDALGTWFKAYEATIADFMGYTQRPYALFVYQNLHAFYMMATIMGATCLSAHDQTAYDNHTRTFLSLVTATIEVMKDSQRHEASGMIGRTSMVGERKFVLSLNTQWPTAMPSPPMYFVAIKCRVHRIRVQAAKLLLPQCWTLGCELANADCARASAKEIIRLEEGGLYADNFVEFDALAIPTEQDLHQHTSVAARDRFETANIELPKIDGGHTRLVCKRRIGASWQVISRVWDETEKRWTTAQEDQSPTRHVRDEQLTLLRSR